MESNCTTIKTNGMFCDTAATIVINGKSFTSGGAFIGKNDKGEYGGMVYGDWDKKTVSNWDGSIKVDAHYYGEHQGNMGDKRCFVRFTYKGTRFFGRWCGMDWTQLIQVKQVKN